jgi:hypothetical protein
MPRRKTIDRRTIRRANEGHVSGRTNFRCNGTIRYINQDRRLREHARRCRAKSPRRPWRSPTLVKALDAQTFSAAILARSVIEAITPPSFNMSVPVR